MSPNFPEVYTGSQRPATFGFRAHIEDFVTPVYRYGWVVSRSELYEALNGEPCRYVWRQRLYHLWKEKEYDSNEYK